MTPLGDVVTRGMPSRSFFFHSQPGGLRRSERGRAVGFLGPRVDNASAPARKIEWRQAAAIYSKRGPRLREEQAEEDSGGPPINLRDALERAA